MNQELVRAIRERRRLSFVYHARPRLGEPQCYGVSTAGKESLRVFLLSGITREREPLFTVAEMQDLKVLDDRFARPGPNYSRGDRAMREIYAEL